MAFSRHRGEPLLQPGQSADGISRLLRVVAVQAHGAPRRTFCWSRHGVACVLPNVRVEAGPTAGRQARAGENVLRTARPGLVARRWASPRPRG